MMPRVATLCCLLLCLIAGHAASSATFVSAADGGNNNGTTNSRTFSFTVGSTGSNHVLIVFFLGDVAGGADDFTSVTYNSVAMTLLVKQTTLGLGRHQYVYALPNPTAGSNSVVISCTANHYILAGAADYSGMVQTAPPAFDGSENTASGTAAADITANFTTTLPNDWGFIFGTFAGTGNTWTSGTYSLRVTDAAFAQDWAYFDSNGPLPAGAQTPTFNSGGVAGGTTTVVIGGGFAVSAPCSLALRGVGC